MTGHNGGVTGISLQGNLAATSSYDSMVRFWLLSKCMCLCEHRSRTNEEEELISGSPLGRPSWDLSPNLHRTRELCALRGIPGTGTSAILVINFLSFATYFIMQRIVSGDFGGEVHLWDLRSKDGKFEVANHRKWECHKVRFSNSSNMSTIFSKSFQESSLTCCIESLIQMHTSGSYCLHTAVGVQNCHWIKVV